MLKHLHVLLYLSECGQEFLPFVETFLQGKDAKSLLQSQVCFSKYVLQFFSYDVVGKECTFEGSFIEVFAQMVLESRDAFNLLIEVGAGLFDPSSALLLSIGGHDHSGERDIYGWAFGCQDFCLVQRLLDLGADPNLGGYRVTPLQIATATSDFDGVERLLKAGALPNNTGSPDGVIWEMDSIMYPLSCLHGASPLKICRDFPRFFGNQYWEKEAETRKKIEELLLHHGAEAFSTTSETRCKS